MSSYVKTLIKRGPNIDNTKVRIVNENTKEVLQNLSGLAKTNIRTAC